MVILGSTGSIGTQAIDVISARPEQFNVVGLSAGGTSLGLLVEQARLLRPEVVAVASTTAATELRERLPGIQVWEGADAWYTRSETGGGNWTFYRKLPERWVMTLGDLRFYVRPTGFKHTGLFPEQAANWAFMRQRIAPAVAQGRGVTQAAPMFGTRPLVG